MVKEQGKGGKGRTSQFSEQMVMMNHCQEKGNEKIESKWLNLKQV